LSNHVRDWCSCAYCAHVLSSLSGCDRSLGSWEISSVGIKWRVGAEACRSYGNGVKMESKWRSAERTSSLHENLHTIDTDAGFTLTPMASPPRTRLKNKSQHPGNWHTRYDTKWCTAAQIATDNVAEAEARLGAIHASAKKREMQVEDIAQYKAGLQKRVEQHRLNALRPDLAATPPSSQAKPRIVIPPRTQVSR
jgi:hypothetical protein